MKFSKLKSIKGWLGMVVCLALMLSLLVPATPVAAATTWYVDDDAAGPGSGTEVDPYPTIQEAVAAAGAGDTVIVKDGTYDESVIIIDNYVIPGESGSGNQDRTGLILRSENGPDAVTINKTSTIANEALFDLYVPQVTIDGFTMKAPLYNQVGGIHTHEADTNGFYTFTNNVLERFYYGIEVFRAYAGYSTVSSNEIICNGTHPLGLSPTGIEVRDSSNNVITDNTIIEPLHRDWSIGIILIWYWDEKDCINNTVSGNTVDGFNKGIGVWGSQENVISHNSVTGNGYGIYLRSDLYCPKTENNVFFANNIINSTTANIYFADTNTLTNYWNSQEEMEYWYGGTVQTGYLGNYWGGYSGTDANSDGIGDTPYQTRTSPAEYDNYPLMGEWHNGEIIPPVLAPVADFSADITTGDAPLSVNLTDLSTNEPTSWEWDFDNDGTVDSYDQNPSYTYTAAGTYTVKLTVTNSAGSDEEVKADYITIYVPQPEWDLNGDHICNIGDVVVLGLHWEETGAPGWIPEDLNSDGIVNIGDVVVLGLHWEETW